MCLVHLKFFILEKGAVIIASFFVQKNYIYTWTVYGRKIMLSFAKTF